MIESPVWNSKKDESIYKAAGALHLRKYGQFFEDLAEKSWKNESTLEYFMEGPIQLVYKAVEDVSILSLVEMENKALSKLLAAVAGTCREIRLLKAEANQFYTKLFAHGERAVDDNKNNFTGLLVDLQDLSAFVKRTLTVIHLTAQQLSSLAGGSDREIYLPAMIEHFIDLFAILLVLDEIVDSQPSIVDQWKKYRMHVRSVMHNPSQFNISETRLHMFDKLVDDLSKQLLQKNTFLKALDHAMEAKKCQAMSEQLLVYLRNLMSDVESKLGEHAAVGKNWIRLNVGVVVATKLFGSCDRKLLKRIQEVNKKMYAVTLVGNVTWVPSKFLNDSLPKEAGPALGSQTGEKVLASRLQKLPQLVNSFVYRAMSWYVQMRSILLKNKFEVSDIERKGVLLVQIFTLLSEMKETIFTVTNLHAALSKPMNRLTVQLICRLVELQKSLESAFHGMSALIVQSQGQIVQYRNYQVLASLEKARKGLIQRDKGYSRDRLDALSLIGLSVRLMNGPASADRRLIVRCALACASQLTDSFKEEDILKLRYFLDNYDLIAELHERVKELCDYSILLQHRNIIPAYLSSVFESGLSLSHVSQMFGAFNSAVEAQGEESREARVEEMKAMLVKNVLEPACGEIETTLRLHVHAHLKLDSTNPFKIGAKDGGRITRCFPLPLAGLMVHNKRYVEHYLDDMFYNLTTVALHDWKTYRTMHALANYKLHLDTVQNHLPTQTLEQGLDALEIMRNIHVFVSRYLYNLNTQTFVEHTSNNKHLNTIGIRHIANSIRTHGTGIMSTTVNFVYQFLKLKLHTFSQFLFDEQIKSRLTRDIRFVRNQRESGATPYTYERARKFQKDIRKLGMTAEGLSYLDQFRQLISQIGNALGYVRLIRSGGLHASSNAVSFLPDINSSSSFAAMCQELEYSQTTQAAARRLEDDIANLVRNFTEGIHYFKLLLDVFAPAFRDPKSHHLQQFFAIFPPLTLSFVDNSLANKEKIFKKNQAGAAFTDDGFAMGVAYLNALLDQSSELDNLHWFQTVQEHINAEVSSAEKKDDHGDEKLEQTRALTLKRLAQRSQEFQLLYYSFSGARVFFKQPDS